MLHCIIIDDEPLARKGLKEYIADADFLHLAGEFDNPVKAMDIILKEKIDLIFLDIQMPKMTGLEFFKEPSSRADSNIYHCLSSVCRGWF